MTPRAAAAAASGDDDDDDDGADDDEGGDATTKSRRRRRRAPAKKPARRRRRRSRGPAPAEPAGHAWCSRPAAARSTTTLSLDGKTVRMDSIETYATPEAAKKAFERLKKMLAGEGYKPE